MILNENSVSQSGYDSVKKLMCVWMVFIDPSLFLKKNIGDI